MATTDDRPDSMGRVAEALESLLRAEVEDRAVDLRLQKDQLRPVVRELVDEVLPEALRQAMPKILERIADELSRSLHVSSNRISEAAFTRLHKQMDDESR